MAEPKKSAPQRSLADRVGQRAERKQRARGQPDHPVWFGLGMFGLVGWSIAVPTVMGIALGIWVDGRWPGEVSWTLTFLIIGVSLGCMNAWYWLNQERNQANGNHRKNRND